MTSPEEVGGDIPNQDLSDIDTPLEVKRTLSAYDTLAAANENYLSAMASSIVKPKDDERVGAVGTAAGVVAKAFGNVIEAVMATDATTEEKIETIATLYATEDEARIRQLKNMSNSPTIEYLRESLGPEAGSLETIIDVRDHFVRKLTADMESAADTEAFVALVRSRFMLNLEVDSHNTIAYVRDTYEQTDLEDIIQIIGPHVLDVLKTAAGVLVAGWILKSRRRS